VFLAGIMQLGLGFLKAGSISNYFPNNVIEGMLAGIGIIIILKQIPHAVGFDSEFEGMETFWKSDGGNTFSTLMGIADHIQMGALIIAVMSLAVLIACEKIPALSKLRVVPAALVAVVLSIVVNELFISSGSSLAIDATHLVQLPIITSFSELSSVIVMPDFSSISNPQVWITALTITIVASIETLLCIEAADRMDPEKRYTNTNRELKAQGLGNMLSGLIGGLPMTSVIVRTSANVNAGAKSKMSAIIHGFLLIACVIAIPGLLNKIPLATLAAVLLLVGYKLAKPATFKHFWSHGKYQFAPFIVTILGVVFTDLLTGVAMGIAVSIIFLIRGNLKRAYNFRNEEYADGAIIHIDLAQEVSFLNKAAIKSTLSNVPEGSRVVIDASDTVYIAHDVLDLIREFTTVKAKAEGIKVKLIGFKEAYDLENTEDFVNHVKVTHEVNYKKTETKEAVKT